MSDQYVPNHILRKAYPIDGGIPRLLHRSALNDHQDHQRKMRGDDEQHQPMQNFLQLAEFRQSQQKQTDRDLGDGEREESLWPIEIVPFEEHLVVVIREVVFVTAEAVKDHGEVEPETHGIGQLKVHW